MGMYKYVKESFAKSVATRSNEYKKRLDVWRRQPTVVRAEGPTNVVRAHVLGYKAKKEFTIVRTRVSKGKRARPSPRLGRKPGKNVKRVSPGLNLQRLAEQRVFSKFSNLSVVNSDLAGEDGMHKYYEVIMR